ncbi:taurine dioxygenase [Alphaproteobacteria bacterium 46_93_T64]|nr:taurine dioxygenase [Alphaproteobacteria bacterium 46_93_T64]
MTNAAISFRQTNGGAGAFVENVDLAAGLDTATSQKIIEALGEYGVLFFRDQHLIPQEHERFAEKLGTININRFFQPVEGHPRIAEVRKEPDQKYAIGEGWHTDHSYDQIPALGSILLAKELPNHGGDTLFANMYLAYDALSDGLKKILDGLEAEHSSRHRFGANSKAGSGKLDTTNRLGNSEKATQDAVHPVVIRHPISGKKALYVNDGFTLRFKGWTDAESKPLLNYLYEHASKPEFTYRFEWQDGSIAMWDNRATWHKALNDYHGERRLMHRITLEGVALRSA